MSTSKKYPYLVLSRELNGTTKYACINKGRAWLYSIGLWCPSNCIYVSTFYTKIHEAHNCEEATKYVKALQLLEM